MTIKYSEELIEHAHWVEQKAQLGDLLITLGKSKKALSDSAEFLPNWVSKGERKLWTFDKSYLDCFAFLREVAGTPVIVYATREEVVDVIIIADLDGTIRLAGGEYDWKRPAMDRLQFKLAAANFMGLEPRLSAVELVLKRRLDEQRRAAAAQQSAAIAAKRQRDHEDRIAARAERKRLIMMRDRLTVFSASGEKMTGVPVVNNEWQSLGNGVDCVLVDSYDNGQVGEVLQHFFVKHVGGSHKTQARVVVAYKEDPTKPKLIEKMGEIVIDREGELDVIACYTRDGLAELKANGLNGGAIRAVWPKNDDGTHMLVSFSKGAIKDIGPAMPIA